MTKARDKSCINLKLKVWRQKRPDLKGRFESYKARNISTAFRCNYELPFRLLADPQRQAYRAFGLQRGNVWKVAGPAIWAAGLKSFVRHGAGMPVGDPLQLAGTFVIDREGIIRYVHHAANSADRPPNAELIAVLEALEA